jgi:hypothetical protein
MATSMADLSLGSGQTNFLLHRKTKNVSRLILKDSDEFEILGAPRDVLLEMTFALYIQDWGFVNRFLLIHRYLYSSPSALLSALIKEFWYSPKPDVSTREEIVVHEKWRQKLQERICSFLQFWVQVRLLSISLFLSLIIFLF